MVYTSVGILESVVERFEKRLLGVRVQLDEASRMFVSDESINDKDVAGSPHRISRLLDPSRYLVTIVVLHSKRRTARKLATATHTHTSQVHKVHHSVCCLLVVRHLSRLSRLCRGRPQPCSRRRLLARRAVFVKKKKKFRCQVSMRTYR